LKEIQERTMRRIELVLLALLAVGAGVAVAEEPPYKRTLQGDDAQKAAALKKQIDDLWAVAKFDEALKPAEELLALRRHVQGAGHWEAADAARKVQTLQKAAAVPPSQRAALAGVPGLVKKASTLYGRGQYAEAEPLFRKALAVYEEVLGPRHPDTATCSSNLAANFQAQGRSKEAEPRFRQALAVKEEALGPRHPDTAQSYNNLAVNLLYQGRYREAEPLLRKALAAWKDVLGPRHPLTANGTNNLAGNLQAQGRYREAEPLLRQALALCEEVLGPRHPDTADSYDSLAYNLNGQGRAKEAEVLLRRALAAREGALGPRHPDTAQSYNNLAILLQYQGRYREAEPLLRKALAVQEEVLGRRHPHTATSYDNLATNLRAQGRGQEAEPLFRQALAVREEVRGPRHPDTAYSYNNLARHLEAQGRLKEAEPLYRKALAVFEEALGPRHPDTAVSYSHLALNLQAQGRYPEAESLWRAAAEGTAAARLRLAASALDKAAAVRIHPHLGLAACRARLGRPADAWGAAEAGLARGLLDDLAARAGLPKDPDADRRDQERAARLGVLDRLLPPLLTAEKLDDAGRRRRDDLLHERADLDDALARAAAERSRQAVLPLEDIQTRLAPDAALVFWVDVAALPGAADPSGEHWGCVVRRAGEPAWVRLPGSGPKGAWTEDDDRLPRLLRDDLARGEPGADIRAHRLAGQRLEPLAPRLAATVELPAVTRLVVVPAGRMAGIPVEALSERYLVSYAPSGSVFARLRQEHRRLAEPTLLAVGDPVFTLPESGPPPELPDYGLYLSLVLPGGGAARAGLRAGDVLLQYGGTRLTKRADLKVAAEGGERVPVVVWREGKILNDLRVTPGKLGVVVSDDPPTVALRQRRERDQLADARARGDGLAPLPGTRLEVAAIAGLLPEGKSALLLGSQASEQELDALRAAGRLKQYRLLHLATHGTVDPGAAAFSALELARDRLPGPEEQARRAAAGQKVYTGRLSVQAIADTWDLDADLVTLSACQTGLGPDGGGEGLLGFSQVLLGRGARSLLLSLWKVDDTATALLMARFYQDLLGQRDGLKGPLPKAEALREAKAWLRALPRAEAEALAGRLARGGVRAGEEPKGPATPAPVLPSGDAPFAHPRYWAAFILIGDPD
jgi:tetratricopeptide (TPR) repeat protein